jgi:hypothetical protein
LQQLKKPLPEKIEKGPTDTFMQWYRGSVLISPAVVKALAGWI